MSFWWVLNLEERSVLFRGGGWSGVIPSCQFLYMIRKKTWFSLRCENIPRTREAIESDCRVGCSVNQLIPYRISCILCGKGCSRTVQPVESIKKNVTAIRDTSPVYMK
jgi:hypothetical protein